MPERARPASARAARLRLGLALLIAAACGGLALPDGVTAAVLIEAQKYGRPVQLVVDRGQQRVLLRSGATETLVDLAAGLIYVRGEGGAVSRAHARFRPGHDAPAPYRVERFGPGPMVAGHGSTYHVLFDEERVCAEAMVSGWMAPFVDPAVRAIALLEQLGRRAPEDACAAIPFTTYAAAGWPLMSGKADHPTFVTDAIRFDYEPAPGELAPPASFREVTAGELAVLVGLAPS
jgi:hypothetical protein